MLLAVTAFMTFSAAVAGLPGSDVTSPIPTGVQSSGTSHPPVDDPDVSRFFTGDKSELDRGIFDQAGEAVKGFFKSWWGFSWAAKLPLLLVVCAILIRLFKAPARVKASPPEGVGEGRKKPE